VATLVLLTLSLFILWQGWKYIQASHIAGNKNLTEETLGSNWMAACMAAAGGYLIGNLFLFEVVSTAVVFWLLLAIITATITKHYTQYNPSSGPPWLRRGAVVMTTLFVGWLVWLGSVSPLLADIHSWRGTKALNSGNPAAALAEYETAVNYQPQQTAYLIAYALTAAQLNNFEQAEIGINEALSLRPNDPVTVSQLAAIYAHKALALQEPDLIELAYDAYEHAITLAPTIALTYQQYADLALRSGDSDIALVQAKQAVNLDATDGISFGILGWAQIQAGDLAEAQKAFNQALRWQPDSADFHLGLATVYFQQGSFEAARLALEQSLIHDPLYPPALTLQVALQDK
jgi:Flp pilus assembly protein TadD